MTGCGASVMVHKILFQGTACLSGGDDQKNVSAPALCTTFILSRHLTSKNATIELKELKLQKWAHSKINIGNLIEFR